VTVNCPECGSDRLFKDGKRRLKDGSTVQRFLCRVCGYRFTDPRARQIFKVRWGIQSYAGHNPAIVLREVEKEEESGPQTRETTSDAEGLIFNFIWHLKKQGLQENSIKQYRNVLRRLIKLGADLKDPESVKEALAKNERWSNSTKSLAVAVYTAFLKFQGMSWKPPKHKQQEKLPFIPIEKEIDDLIAHSGWKLSVALKIAKETGARVGEIARLRWVDIDKERRTIMINSPEKRSKPRILNVSSDLISMIERLPRRSEWVFPSSDPRYPSSSRNFSQLLCSSRKAAARKLKNPRLLRITFHTIRHWKGTIEYHRTRDILHVMELLGHKSIKNTLIYINLERACFKESNDEFIVKMTDDHEEARKLLEIGFDWVGEVNGTIFLRKRR
jgi:integrase